MPVEAAAAAMVALSRRRPAGGVDTYHVVHGREVPVPVVVEVMQRLAPVRLRLVPDPPADPTLLERYARLHRSIAPLLRHQRTFDDTRTRKALGEPGREIDVNLEYLLSGLDLAGANHGRPGRRPQGHQTSRSPVLMSSPDRRGQGSSRRAQA